MKLRNNKLLLTLCGAAFFYGAFLLTYPSLNSQKTSLNTGLGNVATLENKYINWKRNYESIHGQETLAIPMAYSRILTGEKNVIQGLAKINLLDGRFQLELSALTPGESYSVWLTGHSDTREKIHLKVAEIAADSSSSTFESQLSRNDMQGFKLDKVVLTQSNQSPVTAALIAGTPNLFQRMFFAGKPWTIASVGNRPASAEKNNSLPFGFLLPEPAFASSGEMDLDSVFNQQIALGRDLFFNETFDGNGRTCGTCHREDNNHTIDPSYIAKLPQNDPLFVHENNPNLTELENADLVRQLALFKANLDGFDRPGLFRAAAHTLSLSLSMEKELPSEDPSTAFCEAMLGWSGDGSPGCGSLRMFAAGAITQHMTRSLNRVEGVDYRLPTDEEADAIEAYLLSLGRQQPWVLENMAFNSPIVERGKELFNTKPAEKSDFGTGECKGCHFQAGAVSSSSLANGNRNTGVEDLPDSLLRLLVNDAPIDGGFSDIERHDCGPTGDKTCYGNKKFNFADSFRVDTAPFFHNHSVSTIEEAVAFYNSEAFNNADDRVIKMETSTVIAIAQFLRALSAVDNIDSVLSTLEKIDQSDDRHEKKRLLKLAIADTKDAVQVLIEGKINSNPEALKLLKKALHNEKKSLKRFKRWHWSQRRWLHRATDFLVEARNEIVTESN